MAIDEKAFKPILDRLVDPWHKTFAMDVIEIYEANKLADQPVDCREAFNSKWPAARGMDLTTPEDHAELHLIWVGFEAAWKQELESGWQPIETAPKDAKFILGGWYDHGWNVDQCFLTEKGEWWTNNRNDGEPTHWMPWTEPNNTRRG